MPEKGLPPLRNDVGVPTIFIQANKKNCEGCGHVLSAEHTFQNFFRTGGKDILRLNTEKDGLILQTDRTLNPNLSFYARDFIDMDLTSENFLKDISGVNLAASHERSLDVSFHWLKDYQGFTR